ncbi:MULTISPECIES: YlbD family protein [Bacillaceae]|uniref:YlbD family protein n=1 Tax=Bacillaceae TaxID=186817 RepID=UPI001A8D1C20|nr:YlbD family protein [Bacillus sp. NTK034]MBN8199456.1 YlbD family protein [Bacillus sp. NTK034]
MTKTKLHPSVDKFKEFVKQNPRIIKEVRAGNTTWQELYEDWYLLGEEDSRWDSYRENKEEAQKPEEKKSDWMGSIMGTLKQMDTNQMQGYISNLSQALSAVQGVISQFQGGGQKPSGGSKPSVTKPSSPFTFKKD